LHREKNLMQNHLKSVNSHQYAIAYNEVVLWHSEYVKTCLVFMFLNTMILNAWKSVTLGICKASSTGIVGNFFYSPMNNWLELVYG